MSRIVEDLLLLAKAERPTSSTPTRCSSPNSPQDVFVKAARARRPRAWSWPRPSTASIVADPQRLTQAIVQLAQNAVQHTAEASDRIVLARPRRRPVALHVARHGPGVQPRTRA